MSRVQRVSREKKRNECKMAKENGLMQAMI